MAIFADFLDFVEYSTGVEYSDGHEKKFFEPYNRSRLPKKNFVSIGSLVLKILMGGTPPPKKKKDYWGGSRLIFDLSQMHLGMQTFLEQILGSDVVRSKMAKNVIFAIFRKNSSISLGI